MTAHPAPAHGPPAALGRLAVDLCRAEGFALAGVCAAEPSARAAELAAWLAAGRHGSMSWLAANTELRLDPRGLLEGARSIVLVADLYSGGDPDPPAGPATGRIARYARGRDYHEVVKNRLHRVCDALRERFPGSSFRAFTDTAPLLEREHAARAGLGWVGKHTLLIHPRFGSYFFLGGFLTTLEMAPPQEQSPVADHCGTCTRCIDACPTGAIAPYSVDASRCISYLTIERREPIDPALRPGMGEWIYGCDVCQEVCPHNRPRDFVASPREEYAARRTGFPLLDVLNWTETDRREAFTTSAMKRATLAMIKRNAAIAAGNALAEREDPALRARLVQIAADDSEPEMVREAAGEALRVSARTAPPPSAS